MYMYLWIVFSGVLRATTYRSPGITALKSVVKIRILSYDATLCHCCTQSPEHCIHVCTCTCTCTCTCGLFSQVY